MVGYWVNTQHTESIPRAMARILVQVAIYRRLLICRDGHLDQSEAYDISQLVREYGPCCEMITSITTRAQRGVNKRHYIIIIFNVVMIECWVNDESISPTPISMYCTKYFVAHSKLSVQTRPVYMLYVGLTLWGTIYLHLRIEVYVLYCKQ